MGSHGTSQLGSPLGFCDARGVIWNVLSTVIPLDTGRNAPSMRIRAKPNGKPRRVSHVAFDP